MSHFLVFKLAEHICGVPLLRVEEVLPICHLSKPPGTPPFLEGFLNLRGNAVPVMRVRRLFYLPDYSPTLYTPLIVLKCERNSVALLVDDVWGIQDIDAASQVSIAETQLFNNCVQTQATTDMGPIHILSIERLLLEAEQARVSELRQMEQQRLRDLKWTECTE